MTERSMLRWSLKRKREEEEEDQNNNVQIDARSKCAVVQSAKATRRDS